ncbi:MAG TPA: YggS family pyridoxal phosphate-dependent enzyme [Gemmatimonadaceae bacterium]|nr:YggS family pyridoxal phosphate-dependent enzyme [Gemmatimonadaceae bacterium]
MHFLDIADRVSEVRQRIGAAVARGGHNQDVTIIAVTKTHGVQAVEAAWRAGVGDVGENRVQEALHKMDETKAPVRWHLIGHLQRNKVKGSVERFALVHSVDSERLAHAVHEYGVSRGAPVDVLIQVNTSGEESKGGFTLAELPAQSERIAGLTGMRVRGAMTMAPLDAPEGELRRVFGGAREARAILKRSCGTLVTELSMGMSNDYEVAVEEGATMVRLGTILFGARDQ